MKPSTTVRLRRLLVVVVGLLVVIVIGSSLLIAHQAMSWHVYWSQPDETRMASDVAQLRDALPRFEQLRVEAYRNQDWCRNIAYSRGRFSNNLESTCNLFAGSPVGFTASADADFASVAGALDAGGVWVYNVWGVRYDATGRLNHAEFDLIPAPWEFSRWSYVYDPGHPLPQGMPNEDVYTRIDSDWYFHWEDWM